MIKKLNLHGLRVLNTRPEAQGQALNQAITTAGGQVVHCPTLAIQPIPKASWLSQFQPLTNQYAIFTSVNAVDYFLDGLKNDAIVWPNHITVIAIGKTTAQALTKGNIPVHVVPAMADSEHLLALDILQKIENQTVLLIKGEGGRTLIPDTLTARGAHLIILNVYRRTIPQSNHHELSLLWQNDTIDIIVFTSQEAMQNLFVLLGEEAHAWLQQKPCVVISSRLAQAALTLGIKNSIVCKPDTLLDALHQYQGRLIHAKKFRHAATKDL